MPISTEEIYGLKNFRQPDGKESVIHFCLPEQEQVLLKILNDADTEVRLLINETLSPGAHEVTFLYGNLSPGMYSIKLIVQTDDIIDITSLPIQLP